MAWSLRRRALDPAGRAAVARILADPTFELLPLRSVDEQLQYLPAGARVSITASPAKGMDPTLSLANRLAEAGFRAVPHLAARMVRDRRHLAEIVAGLSAVGIQRAFVVGGDATTPGAYVDGLSLLRDLAEIGHSFRELGVPCYPEGHASIPEPVLLEALREKARMATYMTTQLCFSPPHIASWIAARRAEGIVLPIEIGLPGVAPVHRLIAISARIGVRDSGRFLARNSGLVGRVLAPGGFKPDGLLQGLAATAADRGSGVRSVHLYTFNQVRSTEGWRRGYLERIGGSAGLVIFPGDDATG